MLAHWHQMAVSYKAPATNHLGSMNCARLMYCRLGPESVLQFNMARLQTRGLPLQNGLKIIYLKGQDSQHWEAIKWEAKILQGPYCTGLKGPYSIKCIMKR